MSFQLKPREVPEFPSSVPQGGLSLNVGVNLSMSLLSLSVQNTDMTGSSGHILMVLH